MELNINGNGFDNLASNADVVDAAQRAATTAPPRPTCAGRAPAPRSSCSTAAASPSHGLNGGVVDLNQIPFAAIERVEVLKDGASAIYGTDAVGGVINFILQDQLSRVWSPARPRDVTEAGRRQYLPLLRASAASAISTATSSTSWRRSQSRSTSVLRGDQRDFVNTFQPRPRALAGHARHAHRHGRSDNHALQRDQPRQSRRPPAAAPAPPIPAIQRATSTASISSICPAAPATRARTAWARTTKCCGPRRLQSTDPRGTPAARR